VRRTINPRDAQWTEYLAMFPTTPGLRQIMEIDIDSTMTSCGYAVPKLERLAERDTLRKYWEKRSAADLEKYHREMNQRSIDDLPTGMPGGTK
jgi:PP-loop superfamily ATP-utilizing enzyme